MCITPSNLSEIGLVACRNCWQCRANRVNDLVGRCIAEQKVSTGTLAVTLTYAGDTPNSSTLVYADFQKFVKGLRNNGYSVRYIVAGEYGTVKGRAHWHAVLFFTGLVPEVPFETRIQWEHWEHGFSYFQTAEYDGFKYLLKYALKEQEKAGSDSHLAMSKKPPLGHDWFIQLADQYVDQGLSPKTPVYTFRDVFDRKGKRREFWLQGRMREIFLEQYLARYEGCYGEPYPCSEFVEEQEDKWAAQERLREYDPDEWLQRLGARRVDNPWIEYFDESRPDPIQRYALIYDARLCFLEIQDHDGTNAIVAWWHDANGKEQFWHVTESGISDALVALGSSKSARQLRWYPYHENKETRDRLRRNGFTRL